MQEWHAACAADVNERDLHEMLNFMESGDVGDMLDGDIPSVQLTANQGAAALMDNACDAADEPSPRSTSPATSLDSASAVGASVDDLLQVLPPLPGMVAGGSAACARPAGKPPAAPVTARTSRAAWGAAPAAGDCLAAYSPFTFGTGAHLQLGLSQGADHAAAAGHASTIAAPLTQVIVMPAMAAAGQPVGGLVREDSMHSSVGSHAPDVHAALAKLQQQQAMMAAQMQAQLAALTQQVQQVPAAVPNLAPAQSVEEGDGVAAAAAGGSLGAGVGSTAAALVVSNKSGLSHSTIEKQRRDRLNALIEELAELVPPKESKYAQGSGSLRRPKHVVLGDTIHLVKTLTARVAALQVTGIANTAYPGCVMQASTAAGPTAEEPSCKRKRARRDAPTC